MQVKTSWKVELQNKMLHILKQHYLPYFSNKSTTRACVVLTCTTKVFISKLWLMFLGISASLSRCSFTKQQYQRLNAASSIAQPSKIRVSGPLGLFDIECESVVEATVRRFGLLFLIETDLKAFWRV